MFHYVYVHVYRLASTHSQVAKCVDHTHEFEKGRTVLGLQMDSAVYEHQRHRFHLGSVEEPQSETEFSSEERFNLSECGSEDSSHKVPIVIPPDLDRRQIVINGLGIAKPPLNKKISQISPFLVFFFFHRTQKFLFDCFCFVKAINNISFCLFG